MAKFRLGVDIGGTFTDFCLLNEETGELIGLKTPSTPKEPAAAVDKGLTILKAERYLEMRDINHFVHGGTIAVNTLIQRNGANLSLFATEGFSDILEIRRMRMPDAFNLLGKWPSNLIPRERCMQIKERILADGSIAVPLDNASLLKGISKAISQKVDGIVICFINSYKNPEHELQARDLIVLQSPKLGVTCSSEVWPEIREYERAIAAVINAYVSPKVGNYLSNLEGIVKKSGITVIPYVTKSNGGIMTIQKSKIRGMEILLSGPASGVVGASYVAKVAGYDNIITFDMGGTSCDIGLVDGGQPHYSSEEYIDDFPIIMPVVSVSSIGAGGGSIAWTDEYGVLKVGPGSTGADPGPACYDKGSDIPTMTDAYLICGFLNPDKFAMGKIKLNKRLAEIALQKLAKGIGLDVNRTAQAIIEVATANMYTGINKVLSRRGLDPRDYTLVPFGGAGPLQACLMAREFGFKKILVPSTPGTLSAMGALCCDNKAEFIKSISTPLAEAVPDQIEKDFNELKKSALNYIKEENFSVSNTTTHMSVDMHYIGQAFQVEVPLKEGYMSYDGLSELERMFHRVHHRIYSHSDEKAPVAIMNLRVTIIGNVEKPVLKELREAEYEPRRTGTRTIQYDGKSLEAVTYDYKDLLYSNVITAPAIIEYDNATAVILDGFTGKVDRYGNIIITKL